MTVIIRRAAIAGAYATCCFLNYWVTMGEGRAFYFLGRPPLSAVIAPVLVCEAMIFAAVLFGWWLLRDSRHLEKVILAACLLPAAYIGRSILLMAPLDIYGFRMSFWFWPLFASSGAALAYAVLWHHRRAASFCKSLLAHAWPVLAFLYAQAGWQVFTKANAGVVVHADGPTAAAGSKPAGAVSSGNNNIRVVWIIFDELSQSAAAASPAFRAFANRGFSANHVEAAANSTEGAMPTLIDGAISVPARRRDARTLVMRDGTIFGASRNVFDAAREMGFGTAVAGWYHPYCRVLAKSLTECAWTPGWLQPGLEELPERYAGNPLLTRFQLQVRGLPLLGKYFAFGEIPKQVKIQALDFMLPKAREMVTNPRLGLVMLHLPTPHPPNVYDSRTKQNNVSGRFSYSDSVAQADAILLGLLADLDKSGLADRTAVLISADHGFRSSMWRLQPGWTSEDERVSLLPGVKEVPFLVRMPAATGGDPVAFDRPFHAVVTRRLIEAILAGRVQTHRQIAELVASSGS